MRDMRLALTTLLLVGTAHAGTNENNEVSIGSSNRSLRADSANAITPANLDSFELAYARRLDLELVPRLELWAAGHYGYGGLDGNLFTMATRADSHVFTVGGRARYFVVSRLAATARLDVGTARTSLLIEGREGDVSDAGWGGVLGGAVGVDLVVVAKRHFSCGVRFDLGYVAMTGVALAPAAASDPDRLEIATEQASIGHLDLGGRYASVTLLAQF